MSLRVDRGGPDHVWATPFDLSGRGVVITGGNGGIGYGMARALLASGAGGDLGVECRQDRACPRHSRPRPVAMPAACMRFVCDVGDEAQVEAAFAESVAALGACTRALPMPACRARARLMMEMSLDEFRRVQRVNVEGVFLTFRAAARHMADAWPGRLAGGHGQHRGAGRRGAQQPLRRQQGRGDAFVRALAVELARHKIRVNSILPGWIVTEMTERRWATRSSPARCCRASRHAAGARSTTSAASPSTWPARLAYTTGEQFIIDGGYTKFCLQQQRPQIPGARRGGRRDAASPARWPIRRLTHVLIDYENVQPTDEQVRALVPDAARLWVFHGPHQRDLGRALRILRTGL
jgi:NAD(P)-dependent dehydrogenase (short-subunit alcohol dehydrogenase family)